MYSTDTTLPLMSIRAMETDEDIFLMYDKNMVRVFVYEGGTLALQLEANRTDDGFFLHERFMLKPRNTIHLEVSNLLSNFNFLRYTKANIPESVKQSNTHKVKIPKDTLVNLSESMSLIANNFGEAKSVPGFRMRKVDRGRDHLLTVTKGNYLLSYSTKSRNMFLNLVDSVQDTMPLESFLLEVIEFPDQYLDESYYVDGFGDDVLSRMKLLWDY